ncbi:hypothetical protein [Nonomuraea endophytica]|uniref:Uncharacterized protein n=1 Tax=Nonomuraea endophytica TaxID=714136 RepID=A0A7W8A836_9ACTN|nr:hypothetical protein [Nonomuraea endophytica]MBB5081283.1 hypothetical protein [Nonomuraea endophytica]
MTAVVWSNLIRPLESNWPCAAPGCADPAEVAITADGWRYGLCWADAERYPSFDPELLDNRTAAASSETPPLPTP